jgi:hypothetical protein
MMAHMVTNVVVYAIPYMIFMIISMVDEVHIMYIQLENGYVPRCHKWELNPSPA